MDSKFCPNCGLVIELNAISQPQPSQFQPQQLPPESYSYGNDNNSYYHGQPNFQPLPHPKPTAKGKTITAFVLALVALILPIPVIDVIAGVVAIVLSAKKDEQNRDSYHEGFRAAALTLAIIGTIAAIIFTFNSLR